MPTNIMHQLWHRNLNSLEIKNLLEVSDLTLQNSHAIGLLFQNLIQALEKNYPKTDLEIIRTSPIVSVENNFDRLRFAIDNPGRSSTYTRYVDADSLFRTHTTAGVPPTLDLLAKQTFEDTLLVFPGLVYRRDVADKTHSGVFHQVDIWKITQNYNYQRADLLKLVQVIFQALMPGYEPIVYEALHPYTQNGIEVYARINGVEVEILEAGIAHPEVLANSGLDTSRVSGLALGCGLERILMIRKNLPDIRLIRSEDARIKAQMQNLESYKPVSMMPTITRDMSYSVPVDYSEEDISEAIRSSLGSEVEILEEVKILGSTDYQDLPEIAKQRLGTKPDQKNVLVRVVLRSIEKTLTKEYASSLMDEVYRQVNQSGTEGYNAVPKPINGV
jgi:phenylalanyl-tRNA synthetase alpha chain